MKKFIVPFLVILFLASSCKSLNYVKEENLVSIKMPFEEKDFMDTNEEFYTIQNAVGNNMNINRNRVLMAAKTDLSGKIKTVINSIATQKLAFNNFNESEVFDAKATAISQQSIEKIIKVDSKTLRQKKDKLYDYWAVYKVSLEDVTSLINSADLGFLVSPNELAKEVTEVSKEEN